MQQRTYRDLDVGKGGELRGGGEQVKKGLLPWRLDSVEDESHGPTCVRHSQSLLVIELWFLRMC